LDHGKRNDERSLILIENGHYVGYGYIDETDSFSSLEECKGHIKKSVFYPDTDDLIRGFLKNNRLNKIVFASLF
jgi:DNA polymerase-3 subunit epsilon